MNSTTPALIQVEGVSKTYRPPRGSPIEALRGIDLEVRRGEFVAIVGRSGCGKSTLLRIMAGLVPATEGQVTIDERRVRGPRRDAALVFQQAALLPWRDVLENVLLPADIAGSRDEDRARELLNLVGLSGFEHRSPRELSGGMQQRAAICRALMLEPSVLLMDEPFGALDALTREELALELQRMWADRRMTIVLVTHSIAEAVLLADRVAVMSPRPGRLARIVEVAAPRPRSFTDPGSSRGLSAHSETIRRLLFTKDLVPESQEAVDEQH